MVAWHLRHWNLQKRIWSMAWSRRNSWHSPETKLWTKQICLWERRIPKTLQLVDVWKAKSNTWILVHSQGFHKRGVSYPKRFDEGYVAFSGHLERKGHWLHQMQRMLLSILKPSPSSEEKFKLLWKLFSNGYGTIKWTLKFHDKSSKKWMVLQEQRKCIPKHGQIPSRKPWKNPAKNERHFTKEEKISQT